MGSHGLAFVQRNNVVTIAVGGRGYCAVGRVGGTGGSDGGRGTTGKHGNIYGVGDRNGRGRRTRGVGVGRWGSRIDDAVRWGRSRHVGEEGVRGNEDGKTCVLALLGELLG